MPLHDAIVVSLIVAAFTLFGVVLGGASFYTRKGRSARP